MPIFLNCQNLKIAKMEMPKITNCAFMNEFWLKHCFYLLENYQVTQGFYGKSQYYVCVRSEKRIYHIHSKADYN